MDSEPTRSLRHKFYGTLLVCCCMILLYYIVGETTTQQHAHRGEVGYAQFFRISKRGDIWDNKSTGIVGWPGGESLSRLKFKTCAYVTGAGHLLGRGKGREIDRHDCVIRSNDAPVKGYEEDVGEKTTMRTVNKRSLEFIQTQMQKMRPAFDNNFPEATLFIMIHNGGEHDLMRAFLQRFPTVPLAEYTPEKYRQIGEEFLKHINQSHLWISNGFFTLLLLKDICDEIDVYGVSSPEFCYLRPVKNGAVVGDVPYHYYDKCGSECDIFFRHATRKSDAHRYLKEKEVFRSWTKEWKHLRFHSPEWS